MFAVVGLGDEFGFDVFILDLDDINKLRRYSTQFIDKYIGAVLVFILRLRTVYH